MNIPDFVCSTYY